MKKATLIARILLGLIFAVFGLNGFLHFIPMPRRKDSQVNSWDRSTLLTT